MLLTLLALASCAVAPFGTPNTPSMEPQLISEWMVHTPPGPTSTQRECANLSDREWTVATSPSGVVAKPMCETNCFPELERLLAEKEIRTTQVSAASRRRDGWFVGIDGGEFGGALWWFPDSGVSVKVLDRNVRGIVAYEDEVLILTDLAAQNALGGGIHRGKRSAAGWQFSQVAELDGEGELALATDAEGALVLSNKSLSRVDRSGTLKKLVSIDFRYLFPNSIVRDDDGAIYVGMRHFVVRVVERDGQWEEEWLLPKDCGKFLERDGKCICKGR